MRLRLPAIAIAILLGAACGARSALELPGPQPIEEGGTGGAIPDAGPPDVPIPPVDAPIDVPIDVVDTVCVDAGITYIYVITDTPSNLYSYYPPSNSFSFIGTIDCADTNTFSMAVDRTGRAFVEFADSNLFLVDTATAQCEATGFMTTPDFQQFGMGFSANVTDPGETLFIASDSTQELGTIAVPSLTVQTVGSYSKMIGSAELTGTGDGQLYAFGIDPSVNGSHLAHLDKTTGNVLDDTILPVGQGAMAWAFAYWGGDFYFFTSDGVNDSVVTRYDPTTQALAQVGTANGIVVGAGVSTCAPQ